MAKKPILSDVTNILTAGTVINNNSDLVEEAFENTLSRDGSTPNQMEADIDLNSNDLLNVGTIDASEYLLNGLPMAGGGGGSTLTAAQIKAAYESNPNTNAFTDAEKSKLSGVEPSATADQTGAEIVEAVNTELGQSTWQGGGSATVVPTQNHFLGLNFVQQGTETLTFSTSNDGINFNSVNTEILSENGIDMAQRDPFLAWVNNKWHVFGTGNAAGSHDFVVYRGDSPALMEKHQVTIGGGPYRDTILPGGSVAVTNIWAPKHIEIGGTHYIMISMRYGPDGTNAYGSTNASHMKMFLVEWLDLDALTFGPPVAIDFGADTSKSLIDLSVYEHTDGTLYGAVKDDWAKNILICTATNIAGPWTVTQTINDPQRSIEGPCLYPVQYIDDVNEAAKTKLRLCLDNNRTGVSHPTPDVLVGRPYFVETVGEIGTAFGTTLIPMHYDFPVRHGSVVNLSKLPEAAQISAARFAANGGERRTNLKYVTELGDGAATIRPQEGMTYFVNGVGVACNLTIEQGPADRFFLAVFSSSATTGFNILETSAVGGPATIGLGDGGDRVVEFVRKESDGQYYMLGSTRTPVAEASTALVTEVELTAGANTIAPAEGVTYFVDGIGASVDLTINNGAADRFFLAVYSQNAGTGINVLETGAVFGPAQFGFEDGGDRIVEFRRRGTSGQYGVVGSTRLPAAGGAVGLDHWDETATQFFPAVDGGSLGTSTKRIREVSLQARAGDGTAGDNHGAMFRAQDGSTRVSAAAGVTSGNEGQDIGAFHRAYDAGAFDSTVGGTYVWDKQKGQGINFSLTLTSALTIDISDLKIGEEIRIRVRDPNSNTISFTLPSGSITWVGGAVTPATSEIIYVLWRLGVSNIIGIAVEV